MLFDNLTAQWPRSRFILEHRAEEASTRMIDLFCPIGRGARVLVVAPQRAGRTTLLQNIARGIAKNHPTAIILSLLAGERPEDISDSWAGVPGQVMATALDESDARHLQVADITIERAKRLVEGGKEVVILVDSLTRLARAAQGVGASTGRVLIGGWDPLALQRVRGFLGAARALKEGGSLTIIAAVLAGTGIKSDETLLEDLRGVENTSIVLDKALADRRIFPAIDVPHSGTLREELLWTQAQLQQLRSFRGTFPNAMGALGRVSRTRSNAELLDEPPKTGEKAG
jgi:transcription termination factor Rho